VSILKGGFRTITGLIARNSRNNYRVMTTSATMGIRGTDFEVVHVVQPLADAAAGTYNRVYEGITTFQNRAGVAILVSREQTAFVALPSNLPPVLVVPPTGIFGKPTPIPVLTPQSRRDDDGQADGGKPAARVTAPGTTVAPSRVLTAPLLLNPIDSPILISPTTTTISPTMTISPTTTTISPTLLSPTTTTILPTTTTISPTLLSPTTTTISPTTTTISPTTTTISPTLISPTTTTISPILTAPTTTTISPVLTAPTTTIQTAPITSPIIKR
jgi:hypothetical protein